MIALDVLSIAGAAAISLAFALGRFGEAMFVVPSAIVIAGAAALAVVWQASLAMTILLILGLGLYFFGLLIVRVMLHRSVSLRMLAAVHAGDLGNCGGEDIRGRIADVERYGLAAAHGGVYELTAFGRLVAGVVATLYRVTNVEA